MSQKLNSPIWVGARCVDYDCRFIIKRKGYRYDDNYGCTHPESINSYYFGHEEVIRGQLYSTRKQWIMTCEDCSRKKWPKSKVKEGYKLLKLKMDLSGNIGQ